MKNRFIKAWQSFCDYYQISRKDYDHYNSPEMYAQSGFHGPHFREETDIVFHLARFCYNEFGDGWVHLGSPIYHMYFDRIDSTKRFVDIDISKPETFMIKNAKRQIFVEVKWIWQGIYKARRSWIRDKLNSIENDLAKLKYLFDNGCCEHAFMCVIDEEPDHTLIDKANKVDQWNQKYFPVEVLVHSYFGKA